MVSRKLGLRPAVLFCVILFPRVAPQGPLGAQPPLPAGSPRPRRGFVPEFHARGVEARPGQACMVGWASSGQDKWTAVGQAALPCCSGLGQSS